MSEDVKPAPKQRLSPKEHARKRNVRSIKNAWEGYMFLLPWMIGVTAFVAVPFIFSIFLSFNKLTIKADGSGFQYNFVGWDNYLYAFLEDNLFPLQMFNFFREALFVIPITVIFALIIAIFLNQKFKGRAFFRTVFFLPVIFASGRVLIELFNQGQGDAPLLDRYNVADILYETFPESMATTLITILSRFVLILWFSGVQVIIFLAAFQTVAPSTYEAVRIDGATPWESFWKITFPAIAPFIMLNLIYTTIDLSANPFNPILEHFQKNIINPETGYGYVSAMGWTYSIFIFLLIGLFFLVARFLRRKG